MRFQSLSFSRYLKLQCRTNLNVVCMCTYSDNGGFCAMKEVLLVSDNEKSKESVKQLGQVCCLYLILHSALKWGLKHSVTLLHLRDDSNHIASLCDRIF